MGKLDKFTRQSEFLVCVDSDGCAMDTMDIKHIKCFGPCMVKEWNLDEFNDEILKRWNEINLYSLTRGINRFKGLTIALSEIDKQFLKIEGLNELIDWVDNSDELSNDSLKSAINNCNNSIALEKALRWSISVNESIDQLDESEKLPFELAKQALKTAKEKADVAIVSSANHEAVVEEWQKHGLLEYTDIVLAQDSGSKAFCISELLKKGYKKENVIMCGDVPGDMKAAESNGVLYFPILVKRENESWQEFIDIAFDLFINEKYSGEYQNQKIKKFKENLGG